MINNPTVLVIAYVSTLRDFKSLGGVSAEILMP